MKPYRAVLFDFFGTLVPNFKLSEHKDAQPSPPFHGGEGDGQSPDFSSILSKPDLFYRECMLALSSIVLCVLMTGCYPWPYPTRMGFSGRVVDAQTLAPLPDAHISFGTNTATLAISKADGSFAVPPKREWRIIFLTGDYFSLRWIGGPVRIRHDGYETNIVKIYSIDADQHFYKRKDIGLIPLKSLP